MGTYYPMPKMKPGPVREYKVKKEERIKKRIRSEIKCLDERSVKHYQYTLDFLVTFAMGYRDLGIQGENPFEERLMNYKFHLQRCGFEIGKLNRLIGKIAGKFKYGDISYRICKKVRL